MLINAVINLQNIIAFLLGILSGVLLLFAILLIIFSSKKKSKKLIYRPDNKAIDEKKIQEMIASKQKDLLYQVEEYDKNLLPTCYSLSLELVHEISSHYYPDSQYPEYEFERNVVGNYGPYVQSERKEIYHAFIKYLIEIGRAYPCFCTPEELEQVRENQTKAQERTGSPCADIWTGSAPRRIISRTSTTSSPTCLRSGGS